MNATRKDRSVSPGGGIRASRSQGARNSAAMKRTISSIAVSQLHQYDASGKPRRFNRSLVLCWRTGDLRDAESLFERLSAHGVELLVRLKADTTCAPWPRAALLCRSEVAV